MEKMLKERKYAPYLQPNFWYIESRSEFHFRYM